MALEAVEVVESVSRSEGQRLIGTPLTPRVGGPSSAGHDWQRDKEIASPPLSRGVAGKDARGESASRRAASSYSVEYAEDIGVFDPYERKAKWPIALSMYALASALVRYVFSDVNPPSPPSAVLENALMGDGTLPVHESCRPRLSGASLAASARCRSYKARRRRRRAPDGFRPAGFN